jgi:hypothetical protein
MVQRRIREDAASAGAEGGEQSPFRAIGSIPLTFIPLTFSCFSILHPPSAILVWIADEPQWSIRVSLSEFESIPVNLTSRQGGPAIRQNHAVSRRFLPRITRIARMEMSLSVSIRAIRGSNSLLATPLRCLFCVLSRLCAVIKRRVFAVQ